MREKDRSSSQGRVAATARSACTGRVPSAFRTTTLQLPARGFYSTVCRSLPEALATQNHSVPGLDAGAWPVWRR